MTALGRTESFVPAQHGDKPRINAQPRGDRRSRTQNSGTAHNNRVLYRDGSPVAALVSGEIEWIERLEPAAERLTEDALVKRQIGSPLLAYLR